MIVSYSNGTDFLQANQALLQENPYLSTFFTLDAPLLKQADTINYALRCEQGDNWLLALKVEPYTFCCSVTRPAFRSCCDFCLTAAASSKTTSARRSLGT